MTRRPVLSALALTVVLGGLVACGVSGSDDAAGGPTSDPGATGTGATATSSPATPAPTTENGTDGPTTTDDGDEVCDALRVISDFDVESSRFVAGTEDYGEVVAYFEDRTPDVVAAYDDAIEVVGGDLGADLVTLRDFTDGFLRAARSSSSFQELQGAVLADPVTAEASDAAVRLDTFALDTCGFSTGDN